MLNKKKGDFHAGIHRMEKLFFSDRTSHAESKRHKKIGTDK